LRTPLTALRLSLDNIADGVEDEFAREDVEQATAEVVRTSRLVNALLVLARVDAKVSAAEPLPLCELIEERLSVWRPASDERGVRIELGGTLTADCECRPVPAFSTRYWTTCSPTRWRSSARGPAQHSALPDEVRQGGIGAVGVG
jgi:signal transduction histidine kinase